MCEAQLPATSIRVETNSAPIRLRNDRSIAALTAVRRMQKPDMFTVGLTEVRIETRIESRSRMMVHGNRISACMRPQFTVYLSLDPHTVSVASEFSEHSCAFNHIKAHETRHVEVNQRALDEAARELEFAMREAFGDQPIHGSPEELKAWLPAHIRDEWMPWVRAQMDGTLQLHRQIDTPQEYARNQEVCSGAIGKELNRLRRSRH
ncbi:hypothetical protein NBRC116584_35740 [Hydrogenophaga sp. 5NK40-0174]